MQASAAGGGLVPHFGHRINIYRESQLEYYYYYYTIII